MSSTTTSTIAKTVSRGISKIINGRMTKDGGSVKLKRILGGGYSELTDPFLLLDEFKSDNPNDYKDGFPSHPHRGFETVTYMLEGNFEHRDSKGNHGVLTPGSVQWMTAGRGIIHSEMPIIQKDGLIWGFQLWVNLPKKFKMVEPRYQDIQSEDIPEVTHGDGSKVRVIAGQYKDVKGAVNGVATDPLYLDVSLPPNTKFTHQLPYQHHSFAYVFKGSAAFGPETLKSPKNTDPIGNILMESQLGLLQPIVFHDKGDETSSIPNINSKIDVESSTKGVRFLLIAGNPIKEPIARYGPFVMNTQQEIDQAFKDYQNGVF
eukprot:gene4571-5696_t